MGKISGDRPAIQVMYLRDRVQPCIVLIQERPDQLGIQDAVVHPDAVIAEILCGILQSVPYVCGIHPVKTIVRNQGGRSSVQLLVFLRGIPCRLEGRSAVSSFRRIRQKSVDSCGNDDRRKHSRPDSFF